MAVEVICDGRLRGVRWGSAPGTDPGHVVGFSPLNENPMLYVHEDDDPGSLYGIKFYHHKAGDNRGSNRRADHRSAMTMLVSHGSWRQRVWSEISRKLIDVRLTTPGDFVVWGPGLKHSWFPEKDSTMLTVKWTSMAASIRLAKEAYVVAQLMKPERNQYTAESFADVLQMVRQQVDAMDDGKLDYEVENEPGKRHTDRLKYSSRSCFTSRTIQLAECSVWPKMGERDWARGMVPEVAQMFKGKNDAQINEMREYARRGLYDTFPLIVYPRELNRQQFRIDDGNHRAIALFLEGKTQCIALIGTPREGKGPYWDWPYGEQLV